MYSIKLYILHLSYIQYSPVDGGQLQPRQPLESIATQLMSHVDASNGGHPPAPCPPPAGDCVVLEVTVVLLTAVN